MLRLVIIVIAFVLILNVFGISIPSAIKAIETKVTQERASVVVEEVIDIYATYLHKPALWVWNKILSKFATSSFKVNLDQVQNSMSGSPTQK